MRSVNKKRALSRANGLNIKTNKLAIGTVLNLLEIDEKNTTITRNGKEEELVNDVYVMESPELGLVNIPIAEYFKFKLANGQLFTSEGANEGEMFIIDSFKIVGSEDRKDRDGDVVYPSFMYVAFEEQRDNNSWDWASLKGSGLKPEFTDNAVPVQTYTIEAL